MIKKLKERKTQITLIAILLGVFIAFASLVLSVEIVNANYSDRIFPNTTINNVDVSDLTRSEALQLIQDQIKPNTDKVVLSSSKDPSQHFEIPLSSINYSVDYSKTIQSAFNHSRSTNRIQNAINIVLSLGQKTKIDTQINYSNPELDRAISIIAAQATIEPVYPSAEIVSGNVQIQNGKPGSTMDNSQVKSQILKQLSINNFSPIQIQINDINPTLTDTEIGLYQQHVAQILKKSIEISYEYSSFIFSDADLAPLIKSDGTINQELASQKSSTIASSVNRAAQNSVFVFEDGKVKEFTPSKDGIEVSQQELTQLIVETLSNLATSTDKQLVITIPVQTTKPQITNSEVNDLGINELIGRGTSKFAHSIASRVHNVALAASKVSGVLIKPGETFSFNESLGDVSAYTGFQQAYVIRDGKTVLGDGGGVCQVSTTLFRAALDAGLPITERQGHSYRVGYYEQDSPPGIDATVYGPHPDLRFTNNTPADILIQAQADTKNMTLVFELYGTSDGRVAETTKPTMTNVSAPAEDLYQDDPTLPAGVVKQVEYKAWGGTASFNYTVKDKDGNITYEKKFVTNYQPWQAVYLRGTGPTS